MTVTAGRCRILMAVVGMGNVLAAAAAAVRALAVRVLAVQAQAE